MNPTLDSKATGYVAFYSHLATLSLFSTSLELVAQLVSFVKISALLEGDCYLGVSNFKMLYLVSKCAFPASLFSVPYAPNSRLFYQTPHKFIAKRDYFPKFGKKLGLEKNGTN